MKVIAIIGNGKDKFTSEQAVFAKMLIRELLTQPSEEKIALTSGHSIMGGVDIWAEEIAKEVGAYDESFIFIPQTEQWNDMCIAPTPTQKLPKNHKCWDKCYANYHWLDGYQSRNQKIAEAANIVYVIVSAQYPSNYLDKKYSLCYHCKKTDHVKSGACWTAKYAEKLGKRAIWHIIG